MACIFCKIIKCEIPSFKLYESEKVLAFLDVEPLSRGHALVIPKFHGAKLHDIPDDHLAELLPVAKKVALAAGIENYNILQNNGKPAHQLIEHVHVHIIPKPNAQEGLIMDWLAKKIPLDDLKGLHAEMKARM